ncbi:hypothetical protein [Geitlerinema sp. P-1104]|uniref:hypothetical protein n=1 Tax=Geitlerinema sp. P-1104 TaxID=2546230 RepID=UPI001476F0C5|nr:hypothetical protein [Geitlerinema sp. P-1104]
MNEDNILSQLQGTAIEERIVSSPPLDSEHKPLRGRVIRYDEPYEPVATEDWEVLA